MKAESEKIKRKVSNGSNSEDDNSFSSKPTLKRKLNN